MRRTCKKCGKEFLTEADPYAIIPTHKGNEINCGCYFTVKLKAKIKRLQQSKLDKFAMAIITGFSSRGIETDPRGQRMTSEIVIQQAKSLLQMLNCERDS